MTNDQTVTQADRDAAVSAYESERVKTAAYRINIALGRLDDDPLVQAFARHRTAHSGEGREGVEETTCAHCEAQIFLMGADYLDQLEQALNDAGAPKWSADRMEKFNLVKRIAALGEGRSNDDVLRCDDCGRANPVWFAPSDVWNLVVGGPDATDDPGGVLCPICFIAKAEAAGIKPNGWRIEPEGRGKEAGDGGPLLVDQAWLDRRQSEADACSEAGPPARQAVMPGDPPHLGQTTLQWYLNYEFGWPHSLRESNIAAEAFKDGYRAALSAPQGEVERLRTALDDLLEDIEDEWIDHYLRPDSAERAKCKRCGGDDFFKGSIEHKPGCLVGRIRAALAQPEAGDQNHG